MCGMLRCHHLDCYLPVFVFGFGLVYPPLPSDACGERVLPLFRKVSDADLLSLLSCSAYRAENAAAPCPEVDERHGVECVLALAEGDGGVRRASCVERSLQKLNGCG